MHLHFVSFLYSQSVQGIKIYPGEKTKACLSRTVNSMATNNLEI